MSGRSALLLVLRAAESDLWSVYDCSLLVRQRSRVGPDGGQPAWRLQSGAVRAQWGDRMVLWHWCSKMLVCGSRQHYVWQDAVWHQGAKQCNGMFPAWHFWSCHVCIRIKLKAVTQVCSPNQHVTYLQTAVWILHKLLSKYQKLRITIQGIMMLNIIFEILYVKLLVWMWRVRSMLVAFHVQN